MSAGGSRAALEGSADVFVEWNLYDRVNSSDGMCHRAIEAAVRTFALGRWQKPWRLLDLGCGDAAGIPAMFPGATLAHYTGVDASKGALDSARRRLAGAPFDVTLVHDDFLHYLVAALSASSDLVLVGYALHHLPSGKEAFLRECRRVLAPGGWLLLADVFRRKGESREAWCDAYVGECVPTWPGLLPGDAEQIATHLRAFDHPETPEVFSTLLRAAGFADGPGSDHGPIELFSDPPGLHRLLAVRRPDGGESADTAGEGG